MLFTRVNANSPSVSHLDFLDALLLQSYDEMIHQLPGKPVQYQFQMTQTDTFNSEYALIAHYAQTRFFQIANDKGLLDTTAWQADGQIQQNALLPVICVDVHNVSIWYDHWVAQPLFGDGRLLRKGEVRIGLTVLSPSQKVLEHYTGFAVQSDTVSESEYRHFVQENQIIRSLPLPQSKRFKQLFEPVLAIGASSAIIFLFYFIRSKN